MIKNGYWINHGHFWMEINLTRLSNRKIKVKKNILSNMKRARLDMCNICGLDFKENDVVVANSFENVTV